MNSINVAEGHLINAIKIKAGLKPSNLMHTKPTGIFSQRARGMNGRLPQEFNNNITLDSSGILILLNKVNSINSEVNVVQSNLLELGSNISDIPNKVNSNITTLQDGFKNMINNMIGIVNKYIEDPKYVPKEDAGQSSLATSTGGGRRTRGVKRKSKARTHYKNRR